MKLNIIRACKIAAFNVKVKSFDSIKVGFLFKTLNERLTYAEREFIDDVKKLMGSN